MSDNSASASGVWPNVDSSAPTGANPDYAGQWSWNFGDHNHLDKPVAVDDVATTKEEVPVTVSVLANDDSANAWDGIKLGPITRPSHGTAVASADGQSVLYTPAPEYVGSDSFSYTAYNLKGSDTANVAVTVQAVADPPNVSVSVLKNSSDPADIVTLRINASTADTDGSEYIDRLELTAPPDGVSIVGVTNGVIDEPSKPSTVTQDIKLLLPRDHTSNFNLGVSAVTKTVSNDSEAKSTANTSIVLDASTIQSEVTFQALDQSIWDTGDQFTFNDNRFIGVNIPPTTASFDVLLTGSLTAALKAGLQSDLTFKGGGINTSLPYSVTTLADYNKTTDTLSITPTATLLPAASFQTTGPQGSYSLDFIFNYDLSARLGVDLPIVGSITFFDDEIGPKNYSTNLIQIDSSSSDTVDLPLGISGTVAWPNIATTGSVSAPNTLSSEGDSNNFLQLDVRVDKALADIFLGGVDPFSLPIDFGVGHVTLDLLNLTLSGGANFKQQFSLQVPSLSGSMKFENGSIQPFTTGTEIDIPSASSLDANGDGKINFDMSLSPNASLGNETDLGFNVGYVLELLKSSGQWEVGPFSGNLDAGPAESLPGKAEVATIPVFNSTFSLDFAPKDVNVIFPV